MPRAKQASSQTPDTKKPQNARRIRTQRVVAEAKVSLQELVDSNWAAIQKHIPSLERRLDSEPGLTDEIVNLIVLGASIKEAVLASGVPWSTHSTWMQIARDEQREPYATYAKRLEHAKNIFQARAAIAVAQISMGNLKGDAKGLEWILERRAGDVYYIRQDTQTNVNLKLPDGLSLEDALSLARGNK